MELLAGCVRIPWKDLRARPPLCSAPPFVQHQSSKTTPTATNACHGFPLPQGPAAARPMALPSAAAPTGWGHRPPHTPQLTHMHPAMLPQGGASHHAPGHPAAAQYGQSPQYVPADPRHGQHPCQPPAPGHAAQHGTAPQAAPQPTVVYQHGPPAQPAVAQHGQGAQQAAALQHRHPATTGQHVQPSVPAVQHAAVPPHAPVPQHAATTAHQRQIPAAAPQQAHPPTMAQSAPVSQPAPPQPLHTAPTASNAAQPRTAAQQHVVPACQHGERPPQGSAALQHAAPAGAAAQRPTDPQQAAAQHHLQYAAAAAAAAVQHGMPAGQLSAPASQSAANIPPSVQPAATGQHSQALQYVPVAPQPGLTAVPHHAAPLHPQPPQATATTAPTAAPQHTTTAGPVPVQGHAATAPPTACLPAANRAPTCAKTEAQSAKPATFGALVTPADVAERIGFYFDDEELPYDLPLLRRVLHADVCSMATCPVPYDFIRRGPTIGKISDDLIDRAFALLTDKVQVVDVAGAKCVARRHPLPLYLQHVAIQTLKQGWGDPSPWRRDNSKEWKNKCRARMNLDAAAECFSHLGKGPLQQAA
eukprot:TRINITY_DN6008_c0_g1_i4.p1 TRINITY_DN6008_c0_g1~~TRINITY_DN6008_c0_g1_i4.p1  ORF type:complete len:587 (+),score=30.42 TRINITY_DN6008_c0_g1_i4:132-1892(+)